MYQQEISNYTWAISMNLPCLHKNKTVLIPRSEPRNIVCVTDVSQVTVV